MSTPPPGTDPLLRYPEPHRTRIREQASRLAWVLTDAVPDPAGLPRTQQHAYVLRAILEQCAPRVRFEPPSSDDGRDD